MHTGRPSNGATCSIAQVFAKSSGANASDSMERRWDGCSSAGFTSSVGLFRKGASVSESVVSQSASRHTALWIGLLIVACWLLHPILTPAHVEGFSASIVSLALHLNAGHLADYDRLQPVNLEYFTLSRLGTVTWLSLLTGRLALSGDCLLYTSDAADERSSVDL